ncbi:MAG: sterol desaturase family protein [Chloroflexi bacterium]|nr:sterol desaturase family protein [Chloroflexota bacterium]
MNWLFDLIEPLRTMGLGWAFLWVLAENTLIFVTALIGGEVLVRVFKRKAVSAAPEPLTRTEILLSVCTIVINSLVTWVGVILWRADMIQASRAGVIRVLLDALVLFMAMDLLMYMFHRVAHHPLLYPIIHSTHHRYENPRPLTLFVLNPFESAGFGALWLVLVTIYPASLVGMMIYLTLNVVFGLVGHIGVEPLPSRYLQIPVIRYVSTSTFHAEHHGDKDHNYGFYTLIWDKLFGTLSPDYERDFVRANEGAG